MTKLAVILTVLVIACLVTAGYPVFAQGPPEPVGKADSVVSPLLQQFIKERESATSQPGAQPASGSTVHGNAAAGGATTKDAPAASDSASSDSEEAYVRFASSGNVQVYIRVKNTDEDTLQQLRDMGATVEIVNSDWNKVQAWVPVTALEPGIKITPPDYGETRTGSTTPRAITSSAPTWCASSAASRARASESVSSLTEWIGGPPPEQGATFQEAYR